MLFLTAGNRTNASAPTASTATRADSPWHGLPNSTVVAAFRVQRNAADTRTPAPQPPNALPSPRLSKGHTAAEVREQFFALLPEGRAGAEQGLQWRAAYNDAIHYLAESYGMPTHWIWQVLGAEHGGPERATYVKHVPGTDLDPESCVGTFDGSKKYDYDYEAAVDENSGTKSDHRLARTPRTFLCPAILPARGDDAGYAVFVSKIWAAMSGGDMEERHVSYWRTEKFFEQWAAIVNAGDLPALPDDHERERVAAALRLADEVLQEEAGSRAPGEATFIAAWQRKHAQLSKMKHQLEWYAVASDVLAYKHRGRATISSDEELNKRRWEALSRYDEFPPQWQSATMRAMYRELVSWPRP